MPLDVNSKEDFELYQKKMRCFDRKDVKINGSYHSKKGRMLNMQLVKCNDSTEYSLGRQVQCKSEEEIT